MRLSHRAVRYTLPLAAGVAGVTLVAWLALSFQAGGRAGARRMVTSPVSPSRPSGAVAADR